LLAPNAALRWTPAPEQIDPDVDKAALHAGAGDSKERGRLWVETRGGRVRPLDVTLGISDGTMTEVSGKGIEAGLCVVAGEEDEGDADGQEESATAGGDKTSNPFLPKPPKGSRPPPGPM
jgi:HlyD family secretion protein